MCIRDRVEDVQTLYEGLINGTKNVHPEVSSTGRLGYESVSYTHLVVVNPRTGLVCLLETTDLVRCIDVLPAVTDVYKRQLLPRSGAACKARAARRRLF